MANRNRCEICNTPKIMGIQQCQCKGQDHLPTVETVYAWLVERRKTDGTIDYVAMDWVGIEHVTDPWKALWCVRRADAEQLASGSLDDMDYRIVQHAFETEIDLTIRPTRLSTGGA